MWSPYNTKKVKRLFLHRAAHKILQSYREVQNEVTNGRGKKGPFLNLKKSCIISGLRPFLIGDFFFKDYRAFFAFKLVIAP